MFNIDFLTTEEKEKLEQFMEITKLENELAYEKLAEVDWNVERALETFLLVESNDDILPAENLSTQLGNYAVHGNGDRLIDFGAGNNVINDYTVDDIVEDIAYDSGESSSGHQRAEPLIPSGYQSVPEALEKFVDNFKSRYCSGANMNNCMPPFYTDTLKNAIEIAFNHENEGLCRPLIFFINNENSVHTESFVRNVLCNELVIGSLRNKYILYPWDITEESNLAEFLKILLDSKMRVMHDYLLSSLSSDQDAFPLVAIVSRKSCSFEIIRKLKGSNDSNEVYNGLLEGYQQFKHDQLVEISRAIERKKNREIFEEQNAEYQKSLVADLQKRNENKKQEVPERNGEHQKKNETTEKISIEAEENRRVELLAAKLPKEPEQLESDVIFVKFRFPGGSQETRRFYKTDTIQSLFDYMGTKRYFAEKCRFFNSDFPRKEITKLNVSEQRFVDLNWPDKETIFVEKI